MAQSTLKRYTYQLEDVNNKTKIFEGKGVNLFYSEDATLESSLQYGNLWVKSLPRKQIIEVLKQHRGHLQTVGLICDEKDRKELSIQFLRAGATRIRKVDDMSQVYSKEAHDGEYPLRRYSKVLDYKV